MRRNLLFLGMLLAWVSTFAQDRRVTGKVTASDDGSVLPGVAVQLKGTNKGAQTDASGNYSIAVPTSGGTLVFSFVGMVAQEVTIGSRSVVDVKLSADAKLLSEVIVNGYGSLDRRQLAGSATSVKIENVKAMPLGSFDQMLQGQAPGVLIQSQSGQPGAAASVVIRGRGSINGSNTPLYIVDGIQISAANFSTMNPGDFESINVLKDAAATSIYGSRGANGVIVITTKRGNNGKTRFDYDGQYGVSQFPTNKITLMNSNDKIDYELFYGGTPLDNETPAEIARLRTINTDWQKEIFQIGRTHQHQLSATGGNEKTQFYISGNLFKQTGTVKKTGLDRYTGRINIDHTSGPIKIGLNTSLGYSNYQNTTENNSGIASPLNAIRWANPYEVPYDENGRYSEFRSGQPNPVQELNESLRQTKELKSVSTAFIEYQIPFVKGLSARTNWGVDYENWDQTTFFSRFGIVGQSAQGRNGSLGRSNRYNTRFTGTTSLNYTKSFGEHTLSAGLFYELIQNKLKTYGFTGYGLTGNLQNEAGITPGSATNGYIPVVTGNVTQNALTSYFTNITYGFRDRYFVNVGVRRDGSSRFGAENRYANFGSIGASWIISDEAFMERITGGFLTFLKLKASYGTVGNQEGIGNFSSRELFGTSTYDGRVGPVLSQLANPELRWEQKNMFNTGVEFAFFNNRISGSVEYYDNITTALFLNDQLSRTTGFASINRNIGRLQNRGYEFGLKTTNIKWGDFTWRTDLNFTINRNKILELTPTTPKEGIIAGTGITQVGYPINSYFLVEYVGVNPQNGNSQYRKITGEVTETYDPNDKVILGTSDAPYFGGINNTFSFRGFEVSAFFSYLFGNKVYNNDIANVEDPSYYFDSISESLKTEWRSPGDITMIPRADQEMQRNTTRFLEEGKFLRLRNAMVSYSFPKAMVNRLKLANLRMFVQGQNLLTFSKFRGFDPELAAGSLTGAQYPALRTVTFGLNIGF